MALTHLALLVLVNIMNGCNGRPSSSAPLVMSKTKFDDPDTRKQLVDEAFIEQKDVLLDMLESKLKEVKGMKKKKKKDRSDGSADVLNCDFIKDIELKIKSTGLIALGEADISIKYGKSGNTKLNFDASGISNIGKAHLDLGIDDGTLYLPGLSSLFSSFEKICRNVTKDNTIQEGKNQTEAKDLIEGSSLDGRRSGSNNSTDSNSTAITEKTNENTEITIPVQVIMDETTKTAVSSTTKAADDKSTITVAEIENSASTVSPSVISDSPTVSNP